MGCFSLFKSKPQNKIERERPRGGVKVASSAVAISSSGYEESPGYAPSQQRIRDTKLRVFELADLRSATNDFSQVLKIGEGGFGSVYKAFIRFTDVDGRVDRVAVAVKVLNQKGLQGHKQWLNEVQFLGVLEHPNLVKLFGYCSKDGKGGIQRLLVYEYMPNKSLDDHLFNRSYPSIPWCLRLKIALGAAEGLAYLHEGLEVQVIFRDFKTSNILLDDDFRPKLSDFGFARLGPSGDRTHVSTAVVGTHGYAAPEYIETGHLTAKSDVWSFGVVLYELLTGRRPLETNRPANEQKLLEWVKQFSIESKGFKMIMDPRLKYQYSLKVAREVAKLANSCLAKQAKERPSISEVVLTLKQAVQVSEEARQSKTKLEHNVASSVKGKSGKSSD
ncbi:hypothetical protein HPP92_022029 [Vanilla planifolia]|uniref:Protein kinase domain-containing protein n=1 Tax=Vanilla planifolia TaxID=51239 RepID=A0A835Q2C1_VANPL|nr:hypothetical protein HPP92_022029 [Vanilla planifolia]